MGRRGLAAAATAVCAVSVAGSVGVSGPAAAADPPVPRPAPCVVPQIANPEAQLAAVGPSGVRWTVDLVPTDTGGIEGGSTPLVSDGVVYAVASGHLVAVRDSDGSTVWTASTSADTSLLQLADGAVIARSLDTLTAFDAATGAVRWTRSFAANVLGAPVDTARDGLALGLGNGRVDVLDLATGAVRWSAGDVADRRRSGQDPVVADSRTVVRVDPAYVEGYDAVTGRRLWVRHTAYGAPVLTGGVLAVADPAHGVATGLDARSGRVRWRAGHAGSPQLGVNGGVLYSTGRVIDLVDDRTGRVRWRTAGDVDASLTQTAVAAGVLADVEPVRGGGAQQVGRRLRDGHVVWAHPGEGSDQSNGGAGRTQTGGGFVTALLGELGPAQQDGDATALSTATGSVRWQVTLPNEAFSGAAADDGGAVVLTAPFAYACPA